MYVIYCQNKPLSEYLIHKHKQPFFVELDAEIGTKLHLSDYLIKPVQRIMKYQLLLKVINELWQFLDFLTQFINLHFNIIWSSLRVIGSQI